MRTASRPKPVRKALEVHLVNLIQDGDYGLLNNLVLQGRNPQRTLPPIGLRDIDSPRRLRLVCATVYAAVQIDEPTLQPRSVLLPRLTVNARCCLPLQCEIALPKHVNAQMVQQCRELLLSLLRCSLAHTAPPLGHAGPARRRSRASLRDVLLDLRPSLPSLRRRFPTLVRLVHRYYARVRLLHCVHVRCSAMGLSGPAGRYIRHSGGLPVLVHEVSQ